MKNRAVRAALIMGVAAGMMAMTACQTAPTSLLITVTDRGQLTPDELLVSVYGESLVLTQGQSFTVGQNLGKLVVNVPAHAQLIRVAIEARKAGVAVGEGATSIRSVANRQVSLQLSITASFMDKDGDHVPDGIDNCPTVPNPDQADSNHDGIGDACEASADLLASSSDAGVADQGLADLSNNGSDAKFADAAVPPDLLVVPDLAPQLDLFGVAVPLLTAVTPNVAQLGQTIYLEGNHFVDPLAVRFAGVSVAATRLSATRAKVIVPAGITDVDVAVAVSSLVSNTLPFRCTSFTLGLGAFRSDYEQGILPRQTPHLTDSKHDFGAVVTSHYLYVIGGRSGAALTATERALINADGTLDAFTSGSIALNTAREGLAVVRVGSFVYAIGGSNDTDGNLASIERAPINADGTLGSFTAVTTVLTAKRSQLAATVVGDNVLVSGGGDESIERCPIADDFSLGTCVAVGPLAGPTPFFSHSMVARGDWLYLLGAGTTAILRAPIAADGSIGTVQTAPIVLPQKFGAGAVTTFGNSVYILGGDDGTTTHGVVARADWDPSTNLLGPFTTQTLQSQPQLLRQPRTSASANLVGNYLYVIGGYDTDSLDIQEHASINSSAQVDTWAGTGRLVTMPKDDMQILIVGDTIYEVGGTDSSSNVTKTIYQAQIATDGTVGPFSLSAATLSHPRQSFVLVRAGQNVYAIGGFDGTNTVLSVDQATTTGSTLSSFTQLEARTGFTGRRALTAPRSNAVALVAGNYVYVMTGEDSNSDLIDSVERAPLDLSGALTADFATVTATKTVNGGRNAGGGVRIGNTLVLYGGLDATGNAFPTTTDTAESITTDATGATAATNFAVIATKGYGESQEAAVVIGDYVYASCGAYVTNTSRYVVNVDDTMNGTPMGTTDLRSARWGGKLFQSGNYVFVIGGWDANVNIAEIDRAALK